MAVRRDEGSRLAVAVSVLSLCVGTASAHEHPANANGVLSVASVVALAVVLSLFGGTVVTRYVSQRSRALIVRAVGGLLVVLGCSAVVTALTEQVVLTGVATVVGVSAALAITRQRLGGCADATFGAVLLHRVLEGVLLATAATAGLAFGLVGAVVFAGHAAAETCAVGGLYATETQRRALLAVGAVQVALVGGALVGSVVLGAVSATVQTFTLGLVGGVLLAVGLVELSADHSTPPTPKSPSRLPDG